MQHAGDLEEVLRRVGERVEERLEGRPQCFPGRFAGWTRFQRGAQGLAVLGVVAEHDVLLGAEVAEQRASRDADLARDLFQHPYWLLKARAKWLLSANCQ
ncbi:hypothetical protein ACFVT2_13215 [Streptomyces sp. NPDC058000]|uniref:hypothetical protein n=1 Tax=Streptomyces sp. NPDC058000 TaxID=3346299 RepID=UPI0036E0E187